MATDVDWWLDLARTRLSAERTGVELEEAAPVVAPGDLGAIAGFGGMAKDRDLHVSAYVFDAWAGGLDPMEELKAQAAAQGRESLAIVTGSILFFATAGPADLDRVALFDLSSAFSFPP